MFMCWWRRQWQPTPVFLPGGSHGRRSLVGSMGLQRVRHDWVTSLHFMCWIATCQEPLALCPVTTVLSRTDYRIYSPWEVLLDSTECGGCYYSHVIYPSRPLDVCIYIQWGQTFVTCYFHLINEGQVSKSLSNLHHFWEDFLKYWKF